MRLGLHHGIANGRTANKMGEDLGLLVEGEDVHR